MDVTISAVKWQYALVYLDNIIVFLKSVEEHIVHARNVLTLLGDTGVTHNFKKFRLFAETTDYLGQVVHSRRLESASHTTNVIRKRQPPTSLTQLRSFLELCSVF